ncbi:MAG: hypothetical protein ACJ8AW_06505 [Rhodopila sp.]
MTDISKPTGDGSDRLTREAMFGGNDPHEDEGAAAINGHDTAADAPVVTLASLAERAMWVAWQQQLGRGGRVTKLPYNAVPGKGGMASSTDPETWGSRAQAEQKAATLLKPFGIGGIGLVFSDLNNGWSTAGIDLDTCRCPESGAIELWAMAVVEKLASYAEVSPSGTGVKSFFLFRTDDLEPLRAAMGGVYGKKWSWTGKNHPPAVELYLARRFFAITGQLLDGCTRELRRVPTDVLLDLIHVTAPEFVAAGLTAEAAKAAASAEAKAEKKAEKKAKTAEERERRKAEQRKANDRSRSAIAFTKGKALRRAGKTYEEMARALAEDPETSEWTREKGQAADQRELRRIWEKAVATGPVIRVEPGELHKATTESEEALIAAKLPIYQRGKFLMKPVTTVMPASDDRMTQAASLSRLTVPTLVDKLCGVAEFEKYDRRSEDYLRVNPPSQVAQILLDRAGEWNFPIITGVVTCPTLRRDGSLLTAPGYDERTHLYHAADPSIQIYPEVYKPTRELAEKAVAVFRNLLAEFPFVDESSRAVGYPTLITPVIRPALNGAPMHLAKAPVPGTGKSMLFDLASYICFGRPCPIVRASDDPKETEKALAGALLAGRQLISLDNVNGEIGSDLLCQGVERPLVEIRNFGGLELFEVTNVATFFANGNNAYVRDDMVRRTIQAMLDAQMERPELRVFKRNPVEAILADRGRYISCALIIVRAFIAAGMPGKPAPLNGFSDWSNLVRGSLMWLGCADPVLTMEAARDSDPTLATLRDMLTAWEADMGTYEKTLGEVATLLKEQGDIYKALSDVVGRQFAQRGEVDTQRLGLWLKKNENRPVDGRRFVRAKEKGHGGGIKWLVQKI